jgi:osmotically inducible protein OsmC
MSTGTADKIRVLYTAEGIVTGGRAGHGRSSDGRLDVRLSVPAAMGGDDGPGTNPEQLFATGYAACFQSALESAARLENIAIDDSTVTARVGIGPSGRGKYGFEIELHVSIPSIHDRAEAERFAALAHQRCPYSNAIKGNVDVKVTVV